MTSLIWWLILTSCLAPVCPAYEEGQYGPRPVSDAKHKLILDVLLGKVQERSCAEMYIPIFRLVRRWRSKYEVTYKRLNDHNQNTAIFLDGKPLLKTSELTDMVENSYKSSKGGGYKQVSKDIKGRCLGISRSIVSSELKGLSISQKTKPIFDNKPALVPIISSEVQERHQIDLVIMNKYPSKHKGKTYKYVLSVLDCFSRYLWLRPLQSKSSLEVKRKLHRIYQSEGHPSILQSDQGTEFRKTLNTYCESKGIKRIVSSAYHPESQGKIESSHRKWKQKFLFDVRKSDYTFTNWVGKLQKYASIYNRQYHSSLGTSPFHVYHGRQPRSFLNCSASGKMSSGLKQKLKAVNEIRRGAQTVSNSAAARMVLTHSAKQSLSKYFVGERVYVNICKGHKIKSAIVAEGTIIKTNYVTNRYKVQYSSGVGWYSVAQIAAKCRQQDLNRRKLNARRRVILKCQCDYDECKAMAERGCTQNMSEKCCLVLGEGCIRPNHFKSSTSYKPLSMNYFQKPHNSVTESMDFVTMLFTIQTNDDENQDILIANALAHGLIPEGEIPSDGSCMFHAVAQSLTSAHRTTSMTDVRKAVSEWLLSHPSFNGVNFEDFIYDSSWAEYVTGIATNEWGDHLTLIAIANAYGVTIGIVSSECSEIQYIYPQLPSSECIYLGHEFEFHYRRLVRLDSFEAN